MTGWQRIFQAVADTLPKRVTLSDGSMQRVETTRVPDLALREAIVNALIHLDLQVRSPIQVRRYPDRLEVDNPGCSLAAEDDWEKLRSIARNPTIAQAFTELDLAGTRGTGMRRMRTRMTFAGLRPPAPVSNRETNWFKLTLSFHHLLDDADWTWLARFTGLDDLDRQVLVMARDGRVRNEDVRAVTGEYTLSTSHRLARLRDQGLLIAHGQSKADTWYSLAPAAHPSNLTGNPSNLTGNPSNLGADTPDIPGALQARIDALPAKPPARW
ncbi:MAG: hypothetical protein H6737_24045 [Alphaproteobacteria bacterium]|nr:hypothetical protein [Alphaproteobacteria bacterium]